MLRKWFSSWEEILLVLTLGALVAGFGILIPHVSFGVSLNQVSQGSLLVRDPATGGYSELPRLETDVRITVTGPIARTRLLQKFQNPGDQWVEALYAFPLPENSAVDTLRMVVGDRIIEGQVKEKKAARETYEAAKRSGRKASLVEQHRPNLFSSAVANIPPGGAIEIEIEYQQQLPWLGGQFSLRFPMAITPRYVPARDLALTEVVASQQKLQGGWQILPSELPVRIKSAIEAVDAAEPVNRVSMQIDLQPGFPIGDLRSLYHRIDRSDRDGAVAITLSDGDVPADRDFVLEWGSAEKAQPTAAFFSEATDQGDYGLLMVMPPSVELAAAPPREVTFVIDTSGSMGGESLVQAKAALLAGLTDLGPGDAFNIVEFNSDAWKLFVAPQPVTPKSLRSARRHVGGLRATGGTEMLSAFMEALGGKATSSERLRQIVFITDGAVGNERDIFQYIRDNLGDRRLFMIGIGSAPNSHFMVEAAHFGRGTFTQIGDTANVQRGISELFARLKRPVLTGLALVADGVSDLVPAVVPDLYAGEPIVLAMKLGEGQKSVSLTGRLGTTLWRQDLTITQGAQQSGLRINWARETIHQLMRSEIAGRSSEEVRSEVTAMALAHHLVSPFTSLVAVDVIPSRPLDDTLSKVGLKGERVAGMPRQDLQMAQTALGVDWRLLVGGFLVLLALLIWALRGGMAAKERAEC